MLKKTTDYQDIYDKDGETRLYRAKVVEYRLFSILIYRSIEA